jgi:hypothetical protein
MFKFAGFPTIFEKRAPPVPKVRNAQNIRSKSKSKFCKISKS